MDQMSIFKARSFWLVVISLGTSVAHSLGYTVDIVPDQMVDNVLPLVTAALGTWAYIERLRGKKKLVLKGGK